MNRKQQLAIMGINHLPITFDLTAKNEDYTQPLIIFAHGFTGFKDWGAHDLVADFFANLGMRFLKFNFSHNGTTPDHPTEFMNLEAFANNTFTIELDDLKRVIDYVFESNLLKQDGDLYLVGHSFGGGISILTAAKDKRVKKLVTMASVGDFGSLWSQEAKERWLREGVIYRKNARTGQDLPIKINMLKDLEEHSIDLHILSHAKKVSQPWLIIHGDQDPSVSVDWAYSLKQAQPKAELAIIEGANHTFDATHPYHEKKLPDHLRQLCDLSFEFFKKK